MNAVPQQESPIASASGKADALARTMVLIIDTKPLFGGGQQTLKNLCLALSPACTTVVIHPQDFPEPAARYAPATVLTVPVPEFHTELSRSLTMLRMLPAVVRSGTALCKCIRLAKPDVIIVHELYDVD